MTKLTFEQIEKLQSAIKNIKHNKPDASGWSYDFDFLRELEQKSFTIGGEDVSMEGIEAIFDTILNFDPLKTKQNE